MNPLRTLTSTLPHGIYRESRSHLVDFFFGLIRSSNKRVSSIIFDSAHEVLRDVQLLVAVVIVDSITAIGVGCDHRAREIYVAVAETSFN